MTSVNYVSVVKTILPHGSVTSLKMARVTADAPRVRRPLLRALIALTAVAATALTTVATTHADEVAAPYPEEPTPTPTPTPVFPDPPVGGTTFNISSFNVLGSTHTESGPRARMGSGVYRIGLAVKFLDKHQLDVVGFQELQLDQRTRFAELTTDRYGLFPAEPVALTRRNVQNSIAWNLAEWHFLEGHFVKIPYFDGIEWDMPVVLLQNLQTGQKAYFANFHNPATNRKHRNSTPHRREAERRQVALANALYATGLPVFFTGDMNERERYFCTMAAGAPMKAANGGSYRTSTGCVPPPSPMPVNWMLAGKQRGQFSGYVRDDSKLVNRITDHFVVRATVTMRGSFVPPEGAPVWPQPVEEPTDPTDPTDPGTGEEPSHG